MPLSSRMLRATMAVLLAVGFAACGDDPTTPGGVPPAPTGLAAERSTDGTSIDLTWNAVTGATGYVVERAEGDPLGSFTEVAADLTDPSFTDTGLSADVQYGYRVAAVNDAGTGSFSSTVTVPVGGGGALQDTLDADITSDTTLTADTRWVLSGFIKVANGATLTIEPGTTIVGDTAVAGSSLFILRGAQIMAEGTATAPIVFTSMRPEGSRAPGDWGGLLIIGNGINNRSGTFVTEGPAEAAEEYSGGTDNADNSGVLRYVRIEFAGFDISGGAGQELNALSMYVVGSGTTLEFVQTLAGLDDAFEWWGGAVDGRFLVSYEAGDDHFDWTEGYRGRNQFLIGFQSVRLDPAPGSGEVASDPQGFEADGCPPAPATGCDAGFASEPFSVPVFANFTLVGPGTATTPSESGDIGMVLRRGTGGYLTNGIVARFQSQGLSVRDAETGALLTADSLRISNILLADNAANYDADDSGDLGVEAAFAASNHVQDAGTADALFTSIDPASLDWTPPAGSPAESGAGTVTLPADEEFTGNFFGGTLTDTPYFGAADPAGAKWWEGWTNHATQ
jgi:Fibronectin type III domain